MTTILSLDPATKTGWAVHRNGAIEASGVWDLRVKSDDSRDMRLLHLRAKLVAVLRAYESIDLLVFEASRNLQYGNAIRVAAELQGIIKLWSTDNHITYHGYSPKEIKKFATGKGGCHKAVMKAAAMTKWGDAMAAASSDEIDARWLAELAASEYAEET